MNFLTDKQKESAKNICDAVVDYLTGFLISDGFYGAVIESDDIDDDAIYKAAQGLNSDELVIVGSVLVKEFFWLKNTEIYAAFTNFITGDLSELFDKEGDVQELYNEMLGELFTIIEDYIK